MDLSELDAVTAYAFAWNRLEPARLEDLLSNDVCYASQWVYEELEGKQAVIGHLRRKMAAVKASSASAPSHRAFAELATTLQGEPGRDVVGLTQPDSDELDCIAVLSTDQGKINRIDICMVELYAPARSGVYPGRTLTVDE